jgi:DNA ligase 1
MVDESYMQTIEPHLIKKGSRLAYVPEIWFNDDNYVFEPKMDGGRYVMYDGLKLISRHGIDRTNDLQHLFVNNEFLKGTILDGELVFDKDHNDLVSALSRKDLGITYHVFDILYYKDQDVRNLSLVERRKILETLTLPPSMFLVEQYKTLEQKKKLIENVDALKLEGIVVKNKNGNYYEGWYKFKDRI